MRTTVLIIGCVASLLLTSCRRQTELVDHKGQPVAVTVGQPISAPNGVGQLVVVGQMNEFPFPGAHTTIMQDVNRKNTYCYLVVREQDMVMSCQ